QCPLCRALHRRQGAEFPAPRHAAAGLQGRHDRAARPARPRPRLRRRGGRALCRGALGVSVAPAIDWPQDIHRALSDAAVRQVAYVPDAGHSRLLKLCAADAQMRMVSLTTEEEGVALAAGAWLGGERAVLLMQSSGVGNCINALAMIE